LQQIPQPGESDREDPEGDPVQPELRVRIGEPEAEHVAEAREPVEAAGVGLLADDERCRGQDERLRDDREVRSADAPAKDEVGQHHGGDARKHHDRAEREGRIAKRFPPPRRCRQTAPLHEVRHLSRACRRKFQMHRERVAAESEEQPLAQT
jgi:hypothetical protein